MNQFTQINDYFWATFVSYLEKMKSEGSFTTGLCVGAIAVFFMKQFFLLLGLPFLAWYGYNKYLAK